MCVILKVSIFLYAGYIFLKADFNCHSRIQYAFKMWDNSDTNYLNFEYYVLGPGPFTLSVSNDVEDYKVNWGCRIQPGRQRREAHVKVTGNAVRTILILNIKYFLSNDIVINSLTIICFICLFLWQGFFGVFFKHFLNRNERLSRCCKSDEILCLCVRFENYKLQHFKF